MAPPEIGGEEFYARSKFGGGFGGPGGGFRTGRSSGKATAGTGAKKTTPRTTKTTTGTSSWAKFDTNYFWTGTLIKCRDYSWPLDSNRAKFWKSLELPPNDLRICPRGDFGMLKSNLRSKTLKSFTWRSKFRNQNLKFHPPGCYPVASLSVSLSVCMSVCLLTHVKTQFSLSGSDTAPSLPL